MKWWCLGLVLLLGACSTTPNWTKPGYESAAATREYEDCQAAARTAVTPETGIDEDILATRQADIGRSSIARLGAENVRNETRDRETAIIASCMKSKGFTPEPARSAQPRR